MAKLFLFSLLVTLTAVLSDAQDNYVYKDGNGLLEFCDDGPHHSVAFCDGYIAAAMDGAGTLYNSVQSTSKKNDPKDPPKMYCLPKGGIALGQAERVTVKWLHDHPEKLHLSGNVLVLMAMQDGFPCK